MMGKIKTSVIFFLAGPAILIIALFFLFTYLSTPSLSQPPQVLSASVPDSDNSQVSTSSISIHLKASDSRPILISRYLSYYASPLEPYAQYIVDISDRYHLDYRILIAIAQQESNLCQKIPPGSHNCWGFGIYDNLVTNFDNYPEAIETVAKTLKRDYVDQGLNTPEKIMAKYTPPSLEKGGPWAIAVSQFLSDLE